MRLSPTMRDGRAYSLIELLITIAIIAMLAALLMPALSQGAARARSIRCISNLHQMGIALIDFAHGHDDKFPVQVSTNNGGSAEFVAASFAIDGEFYFSYKHFLPVAPELQTPQLVACPADTRQAASNFPALRNDNLSYFISANPEMGKSDSIVVGDRNITPVFGSIARVGGYRYLKWTSELHQFKGNVLFADGHVEQLKDILGSTNNGPEVTTTSLLMPSVQPVTPASGGVVAAGGGGMSDFSSTVFPAHPGSNYGMFMTNRATNLWTINSTPLRRPLGGTYYADNSYSGPPALIGLENPEKVTAGRPDPPATNPVPLTPLPGVSEPPSAPQPKTAQQAAIQTSRSLVESGVRLSSSVPWWVILLILLALLELRRRLRARQLKASPHVKQTVAR